MAEKRKAETSTEKPLSKMNKVIGFNSTRDIIDELENRGENFMKDIDEAETVNSDNKVTILKHLTKNTYIVEDYNLSQELINVLQHRKESRMTRKKNRRTGLAKMIDTLRRKKKSKSIRVALRKQQQRLVLGHARTLMVAGDIDAEIFKTIQVLIEKMSKGNRRIFQEMIKQMEKSAETKKEIEEWEAQIKRQQILINVVNATTKEEDVLEKTNEQELAAANDVASNYNDAEPDTAIKKLISGGLNLVSNI
jgi:hypothetical protein